MKRILEFTVATPPVPAPRPRPTKDGRRAFATAPRYTDWKKCVADEASFEVGFRRPMHTGPLRVTITIRGKPRGDPDNLEKGILDGLVDAGVLADDRCKIVRSLHVDIEWGDDGPTTILLEAFDDSDDSDPRGENNRQHGAP